MGRSYKLISKSRNGVERVIFETNTIKKMDEYTMSFWGENDLLANNNLNIINDLYIVNGKGFEFEILYYRDCFSYEDIFKNIFELINSNRRLLLKTDIKYINNNINMSDYELSNTISSYFKDKSYMKYRKCYLLLVNYGIIKRDIIDDVVYKGKCLYSGNGDSFYDELVSKGDYEAIYNNYTLDELSSIDREFLATGNVRKLRRNG